MDMFQINNKNRQENSKSFMNFRLKASYSLKRSQKIQHNEIFHTLKMVHFQIFIDFH